MKKFLLTTLLAGASLLTSHAAIIAEENFNYTASIITNDVTDSQINGANGGTGWTAAWVGDLRGNAFTTSNQTYTGLVTSGGTALSKMALNPGPANFDFGANRFFASTTGRVWGSATINFAQVPTYFEFKLNRTTNVNHSALFGFEGADIFTKHSLGGATVTTPFAPALNTTYFLAFTYDTTGTAPTSFFVNPTGLGSGSAPSGSAASASFLGQNWDFPEGVNQLSFYAANGLFTMDNIRLGTTWADVSPIPEPSIVALLGLGALGLLAMRRRRSEA